MVKPEDKIILVVDDEADVRIFLQTVLEDVGFKVITAKDGEEALELIKQTKPDFITIDLVMPKKSGIRLLHELRRNKEWARIPFIIITGHARDKEYRAGLENVLADRTLTGKQIYLEKPVKPQDLVTFICNELKIDPKDVGFPTYNASEKMKKELHDLLDNAHPDTIRKILDMLKKQ